MEQKFSQYLNLEVEKFIEQVGYEQVITFCSYLIQSVLEKSMKQEVCFYEHLYQSYFINKHFSEDFMHCFLEKIRLPIICRIEIPNKNGVYHVGYVITSLNINIYKDKKVLSILEGN